MARVVRRVLSCYRNQLVVLLTPFLLLPLPLLIDGQEAICGYIMVLMAVYWCTEAMPIPVTACIPVFVFPMLGLLTTKQVVVNYMKEITMMFLGGLIVAISLEQCNLHKRFATRILLTIGTKTKWLMFGFMLPTWFLSMWISNTATSAMMLPMVEAVLQQLDPRNTSQDNQTDLDNIDIQDDTECRTSNTRKQGVYNVTMDNDPSFDGLPMTNQADQRNGSVDKHETHSETNNNKTGSSGRQMDEDACEHTGGSNPEAIKRFNNLAKGLTLCVAYSANIGGTGSLTGTNPNVIMKGHADQIWESKGLVSPVNFPSWMIYGLPSSVINLLLLWLYMQIYFLGFRETCKCSREKKASNDSAIRRIILKEHASLGPIKFAEIVVVLLFTLLVMLWFFRDPDFLRGWGQSFEKGYIGDAVPAILVAVSLFIIPKSLPTSLAAVDGKRAETLLDWRTMELKMPWSVVFIFGGGFALAQAATESGLASWIGGELEVLDVLPGWLMVLLLSLIVCLLTEVTSNSATCTLLMPIMASMAEGLGRNPLYLMFPVALSTSFAFMLPVATPPNAIAFSFGRLTVMDMVKAGALINVFCALVVTLATYTWGMAYFNLDSLPWPQDNANVTLIQSSF